MKSNSLCWDVTNYEFTKLKTLTYNLSPYSLLNLRLNLLLLNNYYLSWSTIFKALHKVININSSMSSDLRSIKTLHMMKRNSLFTILWMKKIRKQVNTTSFVKSEFSREEAKFYLCALFICVVFLQLWNISLYIGTRVSQKAQVSKDLNSFQINFFSSYNSYESKWNKYDILTLLVSQETSKTFNKLHV